MNRLAENLRIYRSQTGITRKQIADKLGMTPQAYGNYENGEREPKLDILIKLAAALHVSVDDLLGYQVNEYENKAAVLMSFGFDLVENDDDSIDVLHTEENSFINCICRYRNKAEFVLDMDRAEWLYNKATHNNKVLFLDTYFHTNVDEDFFKVVPPRKDAQKKTPPAPDHDNADDEKATEKAPTRMSEGPQAVDFVDKGYYSTSLRHM